MLQMNGSITLHQMKAGMGNELEMPTGFDDFSPAASRDYANMSAEARKNVDYLTEVMVNRHSTP